MTTQTETFDAEELFHLAIHASNQNETDKAISYLKRTIDIEPKNAKALYMLGSLHAEIGMYDRAINGMQEAIELDPELYTAQFQLGLLELTSGNVENMENAWVNLDKLEENHYLRAFKEAFLLLIQDKFDECIALLQKGISLNNENIPLNDDMSNFIIKIEKGRSQTPPLDMVQPETIENSKKDDEGQRILSAYQSDFNN